MYRMKHFNVQNNLCVNYTMTVSEYSKTAIIRHSDNPPGFDGYFDEQVIFLL